MCQSQVRLSSTVSSAHEHADRRTDCSADGCAHCCTKRRPHAQSHSGPFKSADGSSECEADSGTVYQPDSCSDATTDAETNGHSY